MGFGEGDFYPLGKEKKKKRKKKERMLLCTHTECSNWLTERNTKKRVEK